MSTSRPRIAGGFGVAGFVALVLMLALTSCGKKGPPEPPPGVRSTYPTTYPHE